MDWTENDPLSTEWDASFEASKMSLQWQFLSHPQVELDEGFNGGTLVEGEVHSSEFFWMKGETPKSRVFYPGARVTENAAYNIQVIAHHLLCINMRLSHRAMNVHLD